MILHKNTQDFQAPFPCAIIHVYILTIVTLCNTFISYHSRSIRCALSQCTIICTHSVTLLNVTIQKYAIGLYINHTRHSANINLHYFIPGFTVNTNLKILTAAMISMP